MANIMDPTLPVLSALGYRAIILGSFGGPGRLWHFVSAFLMHARKKRRRLSTLVFGVFNS